MLSYYLLILIYPTTFLVFHKDYPQFWINVIIRSIFSRISITLGEWMYLIVIVVLIIKMVQIVLDLIQNGWFWKKMTNKGLRFIGLVFKSWLIFELIWGVGYQAPSPPEQLSFQTVPTYSIKTLDSLANRLIVKMNTLRSQLTYQQIEQLDFELAKTISIDAYQKVYQLQLPILKKAYFPIIGDYVGYTAFYQPFTTEAIVRDDVPPLELPFTMIHELAHQNGFASEQVANFMAFLIAKNASNPMVQYSLCLQMFTYTQQAILKECLQENNAVLFSKLVVQYKKQLSSDVYKDRMNIKTFWRKHSGLQIEASEIAYDQFLKWHQQKAGIHSYNEVLLWVIGYEKSYGNQF